MTMLLTAPELAEADARWAELAAGHFDDRSGSERFDALLQAALASRAARRAVLSRAS